MHKLSCFKAYDIRGKLGDELNTDIAYRVGRAYSEFIKPKNVVVGGDIRLSSEELKHALSDGLRDEGVDVIDLGVTGTEEIYFATNYLGVDGGIEVTASHNPIDYNGMKLVREMAKPISGDSGLKDIQALAEKNVFNTPVKRGSIKDQRCLTEFVTHLMTYINLNAIRPLKLVVNAGNGAAGHVIDAIEEYFSQHSVPITFIKIHHEADGTFPNGIPNPLLPENRSSTATAVKDNNADMGIAWDGDFDRCFLFDEQGNFIESYYIVGLLAEAFLQKNPAEKIIHDPRLVWNTIQQVEQAGGLAVQSKTGHAFIKECMRKENAIYGGEMSAHHYFRDFAYCDSGMIPWLLIIELLSHQNVPLSKMVDRRIKAFPVSGEINFDVDDPNTVISNVFNNYKDHALFIDETDGISMEFDNWRFNIRKSNTEPKVRLNVESRADVQLMKNKTEELLALIRL